MLCIFGCIYLFQFKFGNFCGNSAKQATALYVHSALLKTSLRKYESSAMNLLRPEVKTIFVLK
jgi:hypothetical protein